MLLFSHGNWERGLGFRVSGFRVKGAWVTVGSTCGALAENGVEQRLD